jgi:RNA polymerase primary sigma factor
MTICTRGLSSELDSLAASLPFRRIELPEFRSPDYEPAAIRQKRTYPGRNSDMTQIARFLAERGVVELLAPEQTLELFREIHWCAYRIRLLASGPNRTPQELQDAVVTARKLVSRIESAEEELYIANRRVIVNAMRPYFWIGQIWMGDFLQEGSRALSNAVRRFDLTRGSPFIAYAQRAVMNRLANYFRDHVRSGSICMRLSNAMAAVSKVMDEWKQIHGREPSDEELMSLTALPISRIKKAKAAVRASKRLPSSLVSLDAEAGPECEATLYDLMKDTEAPVVSDTVQKSEIWDTVKQLPDRERNIIRFRFFEGMTLAETGKELNLTRARIKQIQDTALGKVRDQLGVMAVA